MKENFTTWKNINRNISNSKYSSLFFLSAVIFSFYVIGAAIVSDTSFLMWAECYLNIRLHVCEGYCSIPQCSNSLKQYRIKEMKIPENVIWQAVSHKLNYLESKVCFPTATTCRLSFSFSPFLPQSMTSWAL
jgi:hypothetical protein